MVEIPSADITPTLSWVKARAAAQRSNPPGDVVLTDNQASSDQPDGAHKAPPLPWKGTGGSAWGTNQISGGRFQQPRGGGIKVALHPDYPVPKAMGKFASWDGHYRSYGQDLTIDKGRILFLGGPADSPGLDIKAILADSRSTLRYLAAGKISRAGYTSRARQTSCIKLYSDRIDRQKNIPSLHCDQFWAGGIFAKELSGTYLQPVWSASFVLEKPLICVMKSTSDWAWRRSRRPGQQSGFQPRLSR